mgnify:CR=1 FL=1
MNQIRTMYSTVDTISLSSLGLPNPSTASGGTSASGGSKPQGARRQRATMACRVATPTLRVATPTWMALMRANSDSLCED